MCNDTPKLVNEKTNEKTKLDIEAIRKIADIVRRVEERIRGSKSQSRDAGQSRPNRDANTDPPKSNRGSDSDGNEEEAKKGS